VANDFADDIRKLLLYSRELMIAPLDLNRLVMADFTRDICYITDQ
jgi:hypothetical protein